MSETPIINIIQPAQKTVNVSVNPPSARVVNIQINQSNKVISVNAKVGNVVLSSADIGLGNVENISIISTSGFLQQEINNLNSESGLYYLNTNPSGFITGVTLTGYVQKSQTGVFYLASNPSGYITGVTLTGYVQKSQTGAFYAANNPSGYITGVDLSIYALKSQTGSFITTAQTGLFYPLSNPSGYITGINTGNFITSSQTGIFITTGQTGAFASSFPTGQFITTGQTGAFYSSVNPSGFITSGQTGNFYPRNNPSGFITSGSTGQFITSGQTGNFYPKSNPSGFITAAQTGGFYASSNPSGFITANQTGNLYPASNPSGFVTANQTGDLYPASNPSGFITADQTGNFYTIDNPSNFISSSQTGDFYSNSNPSGFVPKSILSTGLAALSQLVVGYANLKTNQSLNTTGSVRFANLTIDESASFGSGQCVIDSSGNITAPNISGLNSSINNIITDNTYIRTTGMQVITGTKYFDTAHINNLYVDGTQTIVNTETVNVATNYINLNATGGARDAGLFINLSQSDIYTGGAYIGWDVPSNTWRMGTGLSGIDLSILDHIASQEWVESKLNSGTGSFVTTAQTGAFYAANNPSGYITGVTLTGYVQKSQTGAFYAANNPSGYITGVDLSNYALKSQTGSFVTTAQTGAFYAANNPSGYITGVTLTGYVQKSQTGAFYAANNPSGYITGVDLSNYALKSQTGSFVTTAQTGAFYAANNPSGYITTAQTGNFYPSSNPSGFITSTGLSSLGFYDAFDDSTRYAPNAVITNNVSTPKLNLAGDPWWINLGGGDAPTIQGGGLQSVSTGSLWYIGSSIPTTSGNMTLGFIFEEDLNPTTTTAYNNIMNISFSSSPMMGTTSPGISPNGVVHVNFSRYGVASIGYYGGASISCVNASYDGAQYPWNPQKSQLPLGVKFAIIYKVSGNYLTITVPGLGSLTFYDANLSSKVGATKTYFWFEDGRNDAYAGMGKLFRVWGGGASTPLDGDPAYGAYVGGNVPMLNGTGPYQLPGTLQSYNAPTSAPTNVKNPNSIQAGSYGLVIAGNGIDGSGRATGGNAYFEGLLSANLELAQVGGAALGYGTFEIDSGIYAPTSTTTTGSATSLSNITRLKNIQSGDRQIVEIVGNITGGTNTIAVKVYATGETVITYTGTATGTFRLWFNRKTTSSNTDQIYAELWIGTTLISTNRTAFNNGNWYPYQFLVTQSVASSVIVDDIRNTVQKVKMR
jgi:hypothetical protein